MSEPWSEAEIRVFKARIAELEAENARIRADRHQMQNGALELMRERDEARVRIPDDPLWRQRIDALTKERDEARAACAAMRGALEMVCDADEDCKRDGLDTLGYHARKRIDDALSTTVGSELLARLEHLETNLQGALAATDRAVAERDLATARLEKAEGSLAAWKANSNEHQEDSLTKDDQLEAMRALVKQAVEHLAQVDDHDDGPTEAECGICIAENTLDHLLEGDAPRLYRNAVLTKAEEKARAAVAQTFENNDRAVSKGSAPYSREFLHVAILDNVGDAFRALKDPEEGT